MVDSIMLWSCAAFSSTIIVVHALFALCSKTACWDDNMDDDVAATAEADNLGVSGVAPATLTMHTRVKMISLAARLFIILFGLFVNKIG